MKKKLLGWLSYICIGIIVQCSMIIYMTEARGKVAVGGEWFILPAMIVGKVFYEDVRKTLIVFLEDMLDG